MLLSQHVPKNIRVLLKFCPFRFAEAQDGNPDPHNHYNHSNPHISIFRLIAQGIF